MPIMLFVILALIFVILLIVVTNIVIVPQSMVTLSRVITGWGGKSATCSFRLTFLAIRSMNGILTCRPADQVSE